MNPARPIAIWWGAFPPPFQKIVLRSSDTIRSELLGSLKLFAEVKDLGKELLKVNGHQATTAAFLGFQAYIRQGCTFYEAAEVLHHRASPLNYYYAFLNFAKALILLRTPSFQDHNLQHGLTADSISSNTRKQSIIVKHNGVFPLFYRQVMGKHVAPQTKLTLASLFAYCQDIGFEYHALKYGISRPMPCKFIVGMSGATNTAAPVIAIAGGPTKLTQALRSLLEKTFEQVEMPASTVRNVFNCLAHEQSAMAFYQGKKDYPVINNTTDLQLIVNDVVLALKGAISYTPFDDEFLFVLNPPITPKRHEMNETIAIYCSMFALGSLVRYKPHLMEAMLLTKDAWLVERYVKSAPITFLRHFRNLIDGNYFAYAGR